MLDKSSDIKSPTPENESQYSLPNRKPNNAPRYLPKDRHSISGKMRVLTHNREPFRQSLRDQQTVKWVTMMPRQTDHPIQMQVHDRKHFEAKSFQTVWKQLIKWQRQIQFSKCVFDPDFPSSRITHKTKVVRIRNCAAGTWRQTPVILKKPNQSMGIQ